MHQATIRHRAATPDLDAQGRYHPHTLIRLGQQAVATVERDAGVLQQMTEFGRVHDYQMTYHAPAGRDDELKVTAVIEEVTRASVRFAFSITNDDGMVATGVLSTVFDTPGSDASLPEDVRDALLGPQG